MIRIWRLLLGSLGALTILACGLVQSAAGPEGEVATIVASTLSAATGSIATQTAIEPTPAGMAVSFTGGSLLIPEGLATGLSPETIPAVDAQTGAPWDVAPQYVKITLQGYALQGKFFEPQIMIYPAADYAAASASAADSIQRLQTILANPSQLPGNDAMPHLPFANAAQIIGAQANVIEFNGGRGLRVLAEYAQYYAPINNNELSYHFEGLTNDGHYYIVTTLPITAPLLVADSNPSSTAPSGGVPFPGFQATDETLFQNYYRSVTDLLNATSPDQFNPTLTSLDALIQSMELVR
jgi:hypothetical protein